MAPYLRPESEAGLETKVNIGCTHCRDRLYARDSIIERQYLTDCTESTSHDDRSGDM